MPDEVLEHSGHARIVVQGDGHRRVFTDPGRSLVIVAFDQPAQQVQALFIARAPQPVDAIATIFASAVEVVDLHPRDCRVIRFAQQEHTQIARLARRIERNVDAVHQSSITIPIHVHRHAGAHVEGVGRPISGLGGAAEPDRRVHAATQIRPFDRDESRPLNRH
ncbi:MAG: hypothetical protein ACREBD_06985 [Blastocatellia bacterium]